MYAYRYRHLKKKKINGAVWLGGLLLAVIGILLQTNRSFFAKLGEEGAKSCCEKVLDFYLPGLSYSVKDETEWSFVEKVIDVLFYGENYEPESGSYQTQIESDLSYEAILAREAADENYVDEKTGEVIPSVGSADGTSLSDEKMQEDRRRMQVQQRTPEGSRQSQVWRRTPESSRQRQMQQKISRHRLQRQVQQKVRQLPLWQTSKQ